MRSLYHEYKSIQVLNAKYLIILGIVFLLLLNYDFLIMRLSVKKAVLSRVKRECRGFSMCAGQGSYKRNSKSPCRLGYLK